MELNKFDRIVWRINGVVILAVVGLSVIGLCIGILVAILGGFNRHQNTRLDINHVNEQTKKEELLKLGRFDKINGREMFLSPSTIDQDGKLSSYDSRSSYETRNYLFFNGKDSSLKWLLRTQDSLVEEKFEIGEGLVGAELVDTSYTPTDRLKVVNGFIFVIVKDSNGDGVINKKDLRSVAFTSYDGNGFKIVLEQVDVVSDVKQHTPQSAFIFYKKNGVSQIADFDYVLGKIVNNLAIVY
jgi:hypothetical protein